MSNKYENWVCPIEKMTSKGGVRLTESLFLESQKTDNTTIPIYSLQDRDRKGYISAYQIYMHSVDEYDAAMKLVGSMRHWRKLTNLAWFMKGKPAVGFEGLTRWREDMQHRDKSIAKSQLQEKAAGGNVAAMRTLHSLKPHSETNKQIREKSKEKATKSSVVSLIERMEKNG